MNDDDLGFTYQASKSGVVRFFHHGKPAGTIKGKQASKFLGEAEHASFATIQLRMAKLTGNYKRGNER